MTSRNLNNAWLAAGREGLASRDRTLDGHLWYGVLTTGVFCRISCPSPQPKPENTRFYRDPAQAKAEGFRACKRCQPEELVPLPSYLPEAMDALCKGVTPAQTAARVGVAPATLTRAFNRWLGFGPKDLKLFSQSDRFQTRLEQGHSVLASAIDAGFSDDKAIYRTVADYLPASPARARGQDKVFSFGLAAVNLGWLLVAVDGTRLVFAGLGETPNDVMMDLLNRFPSAVLAPMTDEAGDTLNQMVQGLNGQLAWSALPYDAAATAFRLKVWKALQTIAPGQTLSYGELAEQIGSPKAARAIGSACASNPICFSIPCHRVLPQSGGQGGYFWRPWRKAYLLAMESMT